ncbi:MAG: LacI family DNA-binding transcriptional regulator [Phycisphaerales bacterium]
MSTLQEIADRVGVAASTVSRVLNNRSGMRIREEKARSIRQVAADMKFRPSAAARSMRSNQTRQIGIVLRNSPDRPMDNLSVFEMILGINSRLAAEGYVVALARIGDVEASLRRDSRIFVENHLDGVIVTGHLPESILKHVDELTPHCLYVDTNLFLPRNCIQRDEFAVGQMIAQHIVARGYKRLGWYGYVPESARETQRNHQENAKEGRSPAATKAGGTDPGHRSNISTVFGIDTPTPTPPYEDALVRGRHYSEKERMEGVKSVADKMGIPLQYITVHKRKSPETHAPAREQIRAACACETGIVAISKYEAARFASLAYEMGFAPPRDYGLACCDFTYDLREMWPDIAGAVYDRYQLGGQVAEMMLQLLRSPELSIDSIKIAPTWNEGASLRPMAELPPG